MSRRVWIVVVLLAVLVAGGAWFGLSAVSLSALDDPGRVETYFATQAKHFLVGRKARAPLPPAPPNEDISVMNGRMQYGARCAACHGLDGRKPTDIGQWMYPRTPALHSPAVQQYSDAELFVVIRDGVRLTGMPGFSHIHSDEEIWHLVHYVRSLGSRPQG